MMSRDLTEIQAKWASIQVHGWDPGSLLCWRFFLVDDRKERLERMMHELRKKGYHLLELYGPEYGWGMSVTRVERLSVERLHALVIDLLDTSEAHGIEGLDSIDPEMIPELH